VNTTLLLKRGSVALLAAFAALLLLPLPAHAEDGYRYWNYSHLEGDAFAFAQTGPGDFTPEDGAVEGWRFGTSTVSQGIFPRIDRDEVTFDSVCAEAEAADSEKRVAVLIDYGTEADADGAEVPEPRAECAVVPADATGQQVLGSVADVRTEKRMICALDGYPASGCGTPVADARVPAQEDAVAFALPAEAAAEEDGAAAAVEDSSNTLALVGVGVVVLALLAAAIPLYRRNRAA
jgi:hypothetical protein